MKENVEVVCDAGPLISLASSCLLNKINQMNIKFVIPPSVFYESITHPSVINRFKLESKRIKKYVDQGKIILKTPLKSTVEELENILNNLIYHKNKPLKLFHNGEIECLALIHDFKYNCFLIDERTTRLTFENINLLKTYIEIKNKFHVKINKENYRRLLKYMPKFDIIRSADLCAYGFYKGLFDDLGNSADTLNAILWSLKLNGCAISKKEIDDYTLLFSNLEKI